MSQLTINDLPPELTMGIMRFLDLKSAGNAALTCKSWNSMIKSACRWPLELRGRDDILKKMNFLMTTDRKFGTITIEGGGMIHPETYEIFRKHGVYVDKLVLLSDYSYFGSIGALADLLHLMPKLKHAVINIGPSAGVRDLPLDYVLPDMKKLKTLKWFVRDQRFIKCFRKANLTTMIINETEGATHYDSLVEFLSSQGRLTSLTVTGGRARPLILAEIGKLNAPIPLRLTKLSVHAIGGLHSAFDHDNLSGFIRTQKETLKQVTIGEGMSTTLYKSVFALTKMDTLSVSIRGLPRDKNFYDQLKKNHNLRTIVLRDYFDGDVGFLWNFFEVFPNVHSLILRNTFGDMNSILLMARSLSKLEWLSIGALRESSFIGSTTFYPLKVLLFAYYSGSITHDHLSKFRSRLTELSIRVVYRKTLNAQNFGRQGFRTWGYVLTDERFLEIIQNQFKNLKVLNLPG